jgi:hypothetical protein
MLAAKRVVAGECGRTRACTPPLNLHLRENWTRPPSMRERLNLDARRSFRPSASLFSARSAASKAHSTNPVVTKHDTGLTTSRPSAPGGGGVTCRPYRTHDSRGPVGLPPLYLGRWRETLCLVGPSVCAGVVEDHAHPRTLRKNGPAPFERRQQRSSSQEALRQVEWAMSGAPGARVYSDRELAVSPSYRGQRGTLTEP